MASSMERVIRVLVSVWPGRTAERAGFAPPGPRQTVAANVERPGVSGFGLVDGAGKAIVSTTGMPALTPALRAAVATALGGKPALVDLYKGATGLPTLGFVQPVFGVQDEETAIGAVIGLKVVDSDLYRHLKQPGEVARTAETVLLRAGERGIDYLSPLADGTAPLDRTLDRDTPDLAAAEALDRPGGFIQSKDYAGTDVLMVARPLEGVPWVLVRKIDRDEALANSERRLTTMLVVFVLIIVGVAGAMIAVWRHGSSLRASQAAERYRMSIYGRFFAETAAGDNLVSFLSVPLQVGGRVIGALNVFSFTAGKKFDEGHRKMLSVLASRAASAMASWQNAPIC